ncbi:MAG: hypothetical protein BWK80_59745, partial [Desulfobacteraceae bacterium IS3]
MNRKMKVLAGAAVFLFMILNVAGGNSVFAGEKIAVDFGSNGLYVYDGQTLTGLTSLNPENIISWNEKLVGDFGKDGLHLYDGNVWTVISNWNHENIIAWRD